MQNKDKAYMFSVFFVLVLYPALDYIQKACKLKMSDMAIFFFCIMSGGVLHKALLQILKK
jgi:hypothetical protein